MLLGNLLRSNSEERGNSNLVSSTWHYWELLWLWSCFLLYLCVKEFLLSYFGCCQLPWALAATAQLRCKQPGFASCSGIVQCLLLRLRTAGLVPKHVPFSLTDDTIAVSESKPAVCFGFPWRASFVSISSTQGSPNALLNPRVQPRCSGIWK